MLPPLSVWSGTHAYGDVDAFGQASPLSRSARNVLHATVESNYQFPLTIMLWMFFGRKTRTYLFRYQVQDVRVRVAQVRKARERFFKLLLEKRERWTWRRFAEIDYLDLPQVWEVLRRADRHVLGK